ncbi:MAG: hypothetical protein Q8L27_04980 [archaeon]|nr:hypothetical protein [archaeon]
MIKERIPLNMNETEEILKNLKETDRNKDMRTFIDKFSKLDNKKAKKLKEDLENLGIIKLRISDIVKIVDIYPENAVELNKILTETSLDADETNKVLETIKNNK